MKSQEGGGGGGGLQAEGFGEVTGGLRDVGESQGTSGQKWGLRTRVR